MFIMPIMFSFNPRLLLVTLKRITRQKLIIELEKYTKKSSARDVSGGEVRRGRRVRRGAGKREGQC